MTVLLGLATRLLMARLQVVTDTRGGGRAFRDYCSAVFSSGADMLQLREPGAPRERLVEAFTIARSVAQQANKLVVVSDDAALAAELGADVVHVSASISPALVRKQQHEHALLGAATHDTMSLAAAIADETVDYLTVGPVFGPDEPRYPLPGLDAVRRAARRLRVADVTRKPWFAIGGITPDTLDDVVAAGARRVVLTGAAVAGPDAALVVRLVGDRLRRAWLDDESLQDYAFQVFRMGPGGHRDADA